MAATKIAMSLQMNKEPAVPTLQIQFPSGRYHATPWGHHVNEGLIEWPPSPWRLLRALVATGFTKLGWAEIPSDAQQLISKLAAVLPSYRLPDASAAHSRHFMPVGVLAKGREQTTLVFDTWANVGDGRMMIHWPCELGAEEAELLAQLATAIGYLGRSESWAEAKVLADEQPQPSDFNAFPCNGGIHPGRNYEQISLMAAISPKSYLDWYQQTAAPILDSLKSPESTRKPTAKQLEKLQAQRMQAVAPYPPDMVSCLTKDTIWWKGHGWSQPPGSQRVLYWRRSDALQVGVPKASARPKPTPVECMLLAITTPSGNKSALPPIQRTLPQAELVHKALIRRAADGKRINCPSITGQDELGRPLHDHHEHAHTIPLDLDDDGHLDHILIYSKMGLCATAQQAIRSLRRTWTKGGSGDLQLAVVGSGNRTTLRQLTIKSRLIVAYLGQSNGSCVWESATPFVLPRHLKGHGKYTLEGQINAELASRFLPSAQVELDCELSMQLRHFVRKRIRGGVPPKVDAGYGVRITFAEPVHGPILLGYASHFGMGLFRAIR